MRVRTPCRDRRAAQSLFDRADTPHALIVFRTDHGYHLGITGGLRMQQTVEPRAKEEAHAS